MVSNFLNEFNKSLYTTRKISIYKECLDWFKSKIDWFKGHYWHDGIVLNNCQLNFWHEKPPIRWKRETTEEKVAIKESTREPTWEYGKTLSWSTKGIVKNIENIGYIKEMKIYFINFIFYFFGNTGHSKEDKVLKWTSKLHSKLKHLR